MGANAQTTVPTFTASQVLTADQQNQSARTGVPVFATTTTRNDAFGGSGEKTLAEGQLCYVEGTGLQTYNGSSWVTWGATPGYALIASQTIGTTVSSVTVSNVFSSTYDNYLVNVSGGVGSTTLNLRLTLGATATGYYVNSIYMNYNSATVTGNNGQNGTFWTGAGGATANTISAQFYLFGPNLAKNTTYNATKQQAATTGEVEWTNGYLADTTQYTAFTLTTSTGTLTGGTIRVYGWSN